MIDNKLTKLTSRVDTHETLMQTLKKNPQMNKHQILKVCISELINEEREKNERNQLGLGESEIHSNIVNTKKLGHNESSQKPSPLIVSFNSFAVKRNVGT